MDILNRIAEEKIKAAQEEGLFDGLPGKGKPLILDEDPLTHPDWHLAHHVLKSQGFVPTWIEQRQEIEADLEQARAELLRVIPPGAHLSQLEAGRSDWRAALDKFGSVLVSLNRRILSYNLLAPSSQLHLRPLQLDREIAALLHKPNQQGGADQSVV